MHGEDLDLGKDNTGYPYAQLLMQASQKIVNTLLEKTEQHPDIAQRIVTEFQKYVPATSAANKKKNKNKAELPTNIMGIFEWFANKGIDQLQEVVAKKFKKNDPTEKQQDKIDYLKNIAGVETNAFIGNALLQALEIAKEHLLPKLFPLIEAGMQRIGAQFSKHVDTALSQAKPFSPQTEAIQTAARIIYEQAPTMAGKIYDAFKAGRPTEDQANVLNTFYSSIQQLLNQKDIKPTIDTIKESVKSMKFLPSLMQHAVGLIPETLMSKLASVKAQVVGSTSQELQKDTSRTHTPKHKHLTKMQDTKSNHAHPQGANTRGEITGNKGKRGKKTNN